MEDGERSSVFADNEEMIRRIACDNWERNKRGWKLRGQDEEDIVQSCLCAAWELSKKLPWKTDRTLLDLTLKEYLAVQLSIPFREYTIANFDAIYEKNAGGIKHV